PNTTGRAPRSPKKPMVSSLESNPLLCPSPLCPSCKARDWLLLWVPIKPRSILDSKATLSLIDMQRIYSVIAHAWADSTKETYGSGLLAFHIFCDNKNIPKLERPPAVPSIISAFISNLAGSYSGSAISNYVSGVKAWHTVHGLEWALNDTETDALLKAASSLAPSQSKRP
ncbi:hypothetical protein PAXRUDRAFT_52962, partial [Paxillus rubicundulus Ve08.2h10]